MEIKKYGKATITQRIRYKLQTMSKKGYIPIPVLSDLSLYDNSQEEM